jgi:hypothetical protein
MNFLLLTGYRNQHIKVQEKFLEKRIKLHSEVHGSSQMIDQIIKIK